MLNEEDVFDSATTEWISTLISIKNTIYVIIYIALLLLHYIIIIIIIIIEK